MIINLWDMDVEYKVSNDTNDNGIDFVRINVGNSEPEYDLCLNKDQCLELSRVLVFLANEIKD